MRKTRGGWGDTSALYYMRAWHRLMTGCPWNRSKVGSMFSPLDPKQSQDWVFKFKLSHRSFACWQADLCVPWFSARRLIAHLIAYTYKVYKRYGEWCYGFDLSMLMLILQHSVWSCSLWCFYMLFNCYFKECFNAKGRTKNRDIDFLRLFSLGFQRSCIKTEVLCCTQSIMW